jgi:tetratricopeptide (TPR) repeat protein
VLGKTFTREALAALSGLDPEQLESLLASLVRKEVLGVQADPRSPEHGQYGFLQDLVRRVAYETLSKRDRRARHLAAANYLTTAFSAEEDEVVEVVASHYVAAFELAPDVEDAGEIKAKAQQMLTRAGERAASLAAAAEARRYFEQAAELADEAPEQARLLARAGHMAGYAADPEAARQLLERSIAIYETEGDTHAAARVSARLYRVEAFTGHRDQAMSRGERAFAVLSADEPSEELALLAARLSGGYWFQGDLDRAAERVELALDIAEAQALAEPLALALRGKSAVSFSRGHPEEAFALIKHALEVALEHDLAEEASVCYFILSDRCFRLDRYEDALGYLDESLALARRLGSRPFEWGVLAERTYPLLMTGRWDEALATVDELTQEQVDAGGVVLSALESGVHAHAQRGELDEARRILSMFSRLETSTDLQEQSCWLEVRAMLLRAEGRLEEAVSAGAATMEAAIALGPSHQGPKHGLAEALDAAVELGDVAKAEELLVYIESIPPGSQSPFLAANAKRLRARMSGDADGLEAAARLFREMGTPFWLGATLLEHVELTGDEASMAEAREIFESLKARPWLERAARAQPTGQRAEVAT